MTDMNIRVDMGRVQSSVQAAIRPAVEEALGAYDLKGAIQKWLAEPGDERPGFADYHFALWSGLSRRGSAASALDAMVHEGIHAIAKEYVERNLAAQRGDIEEAFRKMMEGSANKLVKAFVAATMNALKEDWGFDFSVKVEHKKGSRDDD